MIDKEANDNREDENAPQTGFPSSVFSPSFGFRDLLGMKVVSAQDGIGLVSIQIDERLMHPGRMVHGGVIFTLADTAMGMALRSLVPPGTPFSTIEAKINYLRPVRSGELLAEGRIIKQGGSTAVTEATVYNIVEEQRQVIAKVLGTFYIKRDKNVNK